MNQISVKTPLGKMVRPDPGPNSEAPESLVFLLLHGLTLMAFAGAVEVLRLAKRVSERTLYVWNAVTLDSKPVQALLVFLSLPMQDWPLFRHAIALWLSAGPWTIPGRQRPQESSRLFAGCMSTVSR